MNFGKEFIDELKKQFQVEEVTEDTYLWLPDTDNPFHGYHIQFAGGLTLSVQFHPYSYSDIRDKISFERAREAFMGYNPLTETLCDLAEDAEIAYWWDAGSLEEFPDGDNVRGFQTPEEVIEFVRLIWG